MYTEPSITRSFIQLFNLTLLLTIATQIVCPNMLAGVAFVIYYMLIGLVITVTPFTFGLDDYFAFEPPGGEVTELLATCVLFYTSYALGPPGSIYSLLPFIGTLAYVLYVNAFNLWDTPFNNRLFYM